MFLMLSIPSISALLIQQENAINNVFIPPLVKSNALVETERDMLALPLRLGGIGITNPETLANKNNQMFISFTRSLTNRIMDQDTVGK